MNVGRHVVFKRFLRIYCPRKWKKTHCIRRKTFVKTMFCYWKTTVNNKIQTVFPSFNRALNTRKTVVFRRVNFEGKLHDNGTNTRFADSTTTGNSGFSFSENVRKCVNNAAFSNSRNLFSERVNTIFFAVFSV